MTLSFWTDNERLLLPLLPTVADPASANYIHSYQPIIGETCEKGGHLAPHPVGWLPLGRT